MTPEEKRKERTEIYKSTCKKAGLILEDDDPLIKYRCDFQESIEDNDEIKNLLNCFEFFSPESSPKIYERIAKQYQGVVYWYNLELSKDNIVKPEYRDLWGFHIMPYCITQNDVKIATKTDYFFNKKPRQIVDYDPNSGNFHKWPDPSNPQYQVVLIPKQKNGVAKARGPGFNKELNLIYGKFIETITVKRDWYYPPIESQKKKAENKDSIVSLINSLKNAFSAVFVKPYFDDKWDEYTSITKEQNKTKNS